MKHIRRKITVSVLGTMLFVFAVLLATVNIFIPEYLTSEARKAILLEDERKDPTTPTRVHQRLSQNNLRKRQISCETTAELSK